MEDTKQTEMIIEMHTDVKHIKKFVDNAPERFASKWTEKVVAGLIGLVMIAVGSAMVAGVVKAAELTILWVNTL